MGGRYGDGSIFQGKKKFFSGLGEIQKIFCFCFWLNKSVPSSTALIFKTSSKKIFARRFVMVKFFILSLCIGFFSGLVYVLYQGGFSKMDTWPQDFFFTSSPLPMLHLRKFLIAPPPPLPPPIFWPKASPWPLLKITPLKNRKGFFLFLGRRVPAVRGQKMGKHFWSNISRGRLK